MCIRISVHLQVICMSAHTSARVYTYMRARTSYLHECSYKCTRVYVYECTCLYVYECTRVYVYECTYKLLACVLVQVHTYIRISVHLQVICMSAHTSARVYTYMRARTGYLHECSYKCTRLYVYECTRVYVYECTCLNVYECTRVNVYECTRVYIYECTSYHTHMSVECSFFAHTCSLVTTYAVHTVLLSRNPHAMFGTMQI